MNTSVVSGPPRVPALCLYKFIVVNVAIVIDVIVLENALHQTPQLFIGNVNGLRE